MKRVLDVIIKIEIGIVFLIVIALIILDLLVILKIIPPAKDW